MRRIVIDTNLLVLLIVGLTDMQLISRHKRCNNFVHEDFTLLQTILSGYDQILVTPHILTEASNLVSQIGEPNATTLRQKLAALLSTQEEVYQSGRDIVQHPHFPRLGLTDAAILHVVKDKVALITVDFDLYRTAAQISERVENFNHLRAPHLLRDGLTVPSRE